MDKNEIVEVLPAFVNGTLDKARCEVVQQAAKQDSTIQNEIALLRAIRGQIKTEVIESSPDWGWRQLEKTLCESEKASRLNDNETVGLPSNVSSLNVSRLNGQNWKRWTIAACCALALQTGVLGYLMFERDSGNYRTLSDVPAEHVIDVRFAEGVSEQEIRALILRTGGVIVAGPTALGLYKVQFPDGAKALPQLLDSALIDYAALMHDE